MSATRRAVPSGSLPDLYARLPFDALSYFYHNRASTPIEARFAGGERWARPAGHAPDRATCVSGLDQNGNRWPGCNYTLDVSRGWYDAGDHGKYVVNGGIAAWTLMNAWERQQQLHRPHLFHDGAAAIPEAGNGVDDLLDEARWEMEFLLAMQVPDGTRTQAPVGLRRGGRGLQFSAIDASGMAHHKIGDARWTALPMPPHLDPETRYLHPPSTAATLNLAATAAQCARIWRTIDAAFSGRCLAAAQRAYLAALRNPEIFAVDNFTGSGGYGDQDLSDEFFWATAELLVTTGREEFAEALRALTLLSRRRPRARLGQHRDIGHDQPGAGSERARRGRHGRGPGPDRRRRRRLSRGARAGRIPHSLPGALHLGLEFGAAQPGTAAGACPRLHRRGALPRRRRRCDGLSDRPQPARPFLHQWLRRAPDAPPAPPVLGQCPRSRPAAAAARAYFPAVPTTSRWRTMWRDRCAGSARPQMCWRDDIRAFSLNEVAINWNAPLVWVSAWLAEPH